MKHYGYDFPALLLVGRVGERLLWRRSTNVQVTAQGGSQGIPWSPPIGDSTTQSRRTRGLCAMMRRGLLL